MKIAMHWFRRDLRLCDNTALWQAVAQADVVIPLFIFDPAILSGPATNAGQVAFMLESLDSLAKNIEDAGGKLILRHGKIEEIMKQVLDLGGVHALYFNRDYEPYARNRDAIVEKLARSLDIEVHSYKDCVLHEPKEVLKADGKSYGMFTPYSRIWRLQSKSPVLPAVKFFRPASWQELPSDPLPTIKQLGFSLDIPVPSGGERAGRQRLKKFATSELLHYARLRDFPAHDATSRLSPHLRFGTLSPRTVLAAAEHAAREQPPARREVDIFINELIWRDFYQQILWYFPHVADSCFKSEYNNLKWENNEKLFAAWCGGRTGFPMVDAGMRQLNTTGWMHNRVRMIVAMFLTKDLLISWQWGEQYFMKKLIDGDLAANNGGWQWSASTGTDAQPYFRIFNPIKQAEKFDPEGKYIRQYVPEVDTLAYSAPIVNHESQRLKALALFKK